MKEYVKIYCCGDCAHYDWKKHRCRNGAKDTGTGREHFYRDCRLGIHTEDEDGEKSKDPITKERDTMTNSEIQKIFCEKYPGMEINDYRPLCPELFTKELVGITIWLDNGDVIQYYPKEAQRRQKHGKQDKD